MAEIIESRLERTLNQALVVGIISAKLFGEGAFRFILFPRVGLCGGFSVGVTVDSGFGSHSVHLVVSKSLEFLSYEFTEPISCTFHSIDANKIDVRLREFCDVCIAEVKKHKLFERAENSHGSGGL